MEQLEAEMARLETQLSQLTTTIQGTDHQAIAAASAAYQAAQAQLDAASTRWLELSDL